MTLHREGFWHPHESVAKAHGFLFNATDTLTSELVVLVEVCVQEVLSGYPIRGLHSIWLLPVTRKQSRSCFKKQLAGLLNSQAFS